MTEQTNSDYWIPTETRLPEKDCTCKILFANKEIVDCIYVPKEGFGFWDDAVDDYYFYKYSVPASQITHWKES